MENVEITKDAKKKLAKIGKPNQLDVKVEVVTPEMAHAYLKNNVGHNRKINRRHVTWLADQMKSRHWLLTHQGLAFDKENRLHDGQHRLEAIIESMTPVSMIVVKGVDEDTFKVLDTGRNRKAADVLYSEGMTEYTVSLSAVARFMLQFSTGKYGVVGKATKIDVHITNWTILEFIKKNPILKEIIAHFSTRAKRYGGIISISHASGLTFLWSKMKKCDLDTSQTFFDQLYTGAGLGEMSPQLFLRNWLLKEKTAERKVTGKHKLAVIIKGWNFFREDKPISKMWAWRSDIEPFPQAI